MEVSKRITQEMLLRFLGAELEVRGYIASSNLRDCPNINDAAYRLLCVWRQEGIKQRKTEAEMKEQLRNALRSKSVNMKNVAAELKHYFR